MTKKATCFALSFLLVSFSFPAYAQEAKHRIGILMGDTVSATAQFMQAFRQGLRDRGYIEGQNISIEYRYAEGKVDRLSKFAAELVDLRVEAIVTSGERQIRAAIEATKTIPIVMAFSQDPVAQGFVASVARPGGNITGLSNVALELSGKRLELLKEVFPKLSRVAVLSERGVPGPVAALNETQVVAKALHVRLQPIEMHSPDDFESAMEAATKQGAGALIVLQSPLPNNHRKQIVDLAAKNRLPGMYTQAEYVEVGGLMSYAPSYVDLYRRAAIYVDKILKGAKPGDLPIEQPTKFEFVINLKAAKQIGLTIPASVLYRADKVIK